MSNLLQRKYLPVGIATIAILVVTVAIRLLDLDLLVSGYFYDAASNSFPLKEHPLTVFFYDTIPWAITGSLLFFIAYPFVAYFKKPLRKHNRLVLALFLSLLIGPGLIVNSIFKENFGRPRPTQSIDFGGAEQHRAVLEANWGNKGPSFPSGHAATPLAFLVLALAARRRGYKPLASRLTYALVFWYVAVSLARIVAGGHHLSDVAWGGYFSFVCAWLSYQWIYNRGK
jgi:membrane-associated phospholipid phosphatase